MIIGSMTHWFSFQVIIRYITPFYNVFSYLFIISRYQVLIDAIKDIYAQNSNVTPNGLNAWLLTSRLERISVNALLFDLAQHL